MTAKEYLESKGLNDHDYIDSGMINHISEMMEEYHKAKQLIAHSTVKPFVCNNENVGVRCTTQCLGCDGFERNE